MMKSTLAHRTMHLKEEQLRPSDTTCPFCSSPDRIAAVVLQKDPVVYLLSCRNCHASSASRMPTQETLSAYYSAYYEGKDKEVAIDIPEKLAKHIFNNTFNYCDKKTISILDFGGGNGEIAVRLSEKLIARVTDEVQISLVDYDHPQNPLNNSKITLAHYSDLSQITHQQYEIIIASAVIEHIPYPLHDLINLFRFLKKDGILYARTPYILPLLKVLGLFGFKLDFTYPGHVHDLGQKFWDNIYKKLPIEGEYEILKSKPSIIATSFAKHFSRSLMAFFLKAPWYILKNGYTLVGGWEVFIRKKNKNLIF